MLNMQYRRRLQWWFTEVWLTIDIVEEFAVNCLLPVALQWWLLQPVTAQGGWRGPAGADQPSLGVGFPSLLPPQRPAAQPALPATEIFPGFSSKWTLTVCPSALVSFLRYALGTRLVSGRMRQPVEKEEGVFAAAVAGMGFRGRLAWGEPESNSISLLLHQPVSEHLMVELCQMHLVFSAPRGAGADQLCSSRRKGKTGFKEAATSPLSPPCDTRQEVMPVSHSQHQRTVSGCEICPGCTMELATNGNTIMNNWCKMIFWDIWQELSAIPEECIKMKDENPFG